MRLPGTLVAVAFRGAHRTLVIGDDFGDAYNIAVKWVRTLLPEGQSTYLSFETLPDDDGEYECIVGSTVTAGWPQL